MQPLLSRELLVEVPHAAGVPARMGLAYIGWWKRHDQHKHSRCCSQVHGWAGPQQADAQADAQAPQRWCLQPTMQQLDLTSKN